MSRPRPLRPCRLLPAASLMFVLLFALTGVMFTPSEAHAQTTAPSSYGAYTATDVRVPPPAPALGPANSVLVDPTFGSRILRVTDANTAGGKSLIPSDAGFTRTFNANATAIKLIDQEGWSYWMEFDPANFKVGDGSSSPAVHALTAFDARWEWSAVNPDVMYVLHDTKIGQYNKATGAMTDLAGPSTGESLGYHVAVVGADAWVCSAAGSGSQDSFTKIFCVSPSNPTVTKLIDVPSRTINGVTQTDPGWPTSAAGETLGIHSLYGSAGGAWLGVTFHQQSWGGNGDAVLNLSTNRWSLVTAADNYWSGHVSLGNGRFVNGGGSIDGSDSRGGVVRDSDDLMNSTKYQFILQPPTSCCWNDEEHNSWFNSSTNPNAPVLFSRYVEGQPSSWLTWMREIVLAATDGSNTVWRMAHTHQGGCYYGEAFAQISNDGRWALFSSYWDGTLGGPAGFDCSSRIDTFIVDLMSAGGGTLPPSDGSSTPPPSSDPAPTDPTAPSVQPVQWTSLVNATVSGTVLQKTSGCDGCGDAGAVSQQQIASGDGYVEFTTSENQTLREIGLSSGNPGTSDTEIQFGIEMQAGSAEVRELGRYQADTSFVAGDLLRIAVVGGQVQYSKNGSVFYTSTVPPTYPLLVDTSLATLGSAINDAVIAIGSSSATGSTSTSAPSSTPVQISGVVVLSVTSTSATVAWTTNEPATSAVEYGTTRKYGSSTGTSSTLVTEHMMTLTGLSPRTTYHFRTVSTAQGTSDTSSDHKFTTRRK